jgi:hypothetical protein
LLLFQLMPESSLDGNSVRSVNLPVNPPMQPMLAKRIDELPADHDRGTSSQDPFEIEQATEFQGRAENGCLVVKATAVGQRDWTFAYRTAWQTTFYRE